MSYELWRIKVPLADDVRLNSRVFQWPKQNLIELDHNKSRLATTREQAEDYLEKR